MSQRDQINAKLRIILDEATDKWGVKVTRVDVKNINPPEDVRITMEKQMTAERNRRALVIQAEGDRQAAITRAKVRSRQRSRARKAISNQTFCRPRVWPRRVCVRQKPRRRRSRWLPRRCKEHGNPAQYLITTRYIESLKEMTRTNNAKVIFMPMETSALLSSVGAIKEVFAETGQKRPEDPSPPVQPRQLPK